MPAKVYFHGDFYNGSWRCGKFSDLSKLSVEEAELLYEFAMAVEDGEPVSGKNKESWILDDGSSIPNRAGYKSSLLWHYHLGPYSEKLDPLCCTGVRDRNVNGRRSGPIVHYKWLDPSFKKEMLIIAFSPDHVPFPSPQIKNNHLNLRSGYILDRNNKIVEALPDSDDSTDD